MVTNRLRLALELLQPSDWQVFEKLASAFLASEFDSLRTMAGASGDGGRDSELFVPAGEPNVLFQYSVSTDWARKIRQGSAPATSGSSALRQYDDNGNAASLALKHGATGSRQCAAAILRIPTCEMPTGTELSASAERRPVDDKRDVDLSLP